MSINAVKVPWHALSAVQRPPGTMNPEFLVMVKFFRPPQLSLMLLSALVCVSSIGCQACLWDSKLARSAGSGFGGMQYDSARDGQCGNTGNHCVAQATCDVDDCSDPVSSGCSGDDCAVGVGCGSSAERSQDWCSQLKRLFGCSGGSGEIYWCEWYNDPPGCESCDQCGNWIGDGVGYRAPYRQQPYVADKNLQSDGAFDFSQDTETIYR